MSDDEYPVEPPTDHEDLVGEIEEQVAFSTGAEGQCMSEMYMHIDQTLLDDDGEWPDTVVFELEDGETESYKRVEGDEK